MQVANFVAPRSGGLRTALGQLAEGYAARGHQVIQVIPGRTDGEAGTPWGTRVTVRAPRVLGTGYRVLTRLAALRQVLDRHRPDRLEVHDRLTLRRLGGWGGVPALVVSHERLDRVSAAWLPATLPLERWADRSNAALASRFDAVVCTTWWAAEEFTRLGTPNLHVVPLGVDLSRFHPAMASPALRASWLGDGEALLLMASRLSAEKCPQLALDTVAELLHRGRRVRLVVAGDGPLRRGLQARAADLPVRFLGFVPGADRLAAVLASADVLLAPGPVETFGLSALEALASGTPAVAQRASALPEVLGSWDGSGTPAGLAAEGSAAAFADAVDTLLDRPRQARVVAARSRAELFPWAATVDGFLAAHELTAAPAPLRWGSA